MVHSPSMTMAEWIVVFLAAPGIMGHSWSGEDAGNAADCIKSEGENSASTTDVFDGVSLLTVSTQLAHRDRVRQRSAPKSRDACDKPRCKVCSPTDALFQLHAAGLADIPGRASEGDANQCEETYMWHDPDTALGIKKVVTCHREPQSGGCFGAVAASLGICKAVCRSCQCSFEDFAVDVKVQIPATGSELQVNANKDETFRKFKTRIIPRVSRELGVPTGLIRISLAGNFMAKDDTLQAAGVLDDTILEAMAVNFKFLGTYDNLRMQLEMTWNNLRMHGGGKVHMPTTKLYAFGVDIWLAQYVDADTHRGCLNNYYQVPQTFTGYLRDQLCYKFSKSSLLEVCQSWLSRKATNPQSPVKMNIPYSREHNINVLVEARSIVIDDHDSNQLCVEERAKWAT